MTDSRRTRVHASEVRDLAGGVEGMAQRDLRDDAPSTSREGKREMRIEIEAAHVANMEAEL